MGFSAGGVVTVFGAARSGRFAAVVTQASGAFSWPLSPELQRELPPQRAASAFRHCMVAENDTTTESERRVCEAEGERRRRRSHGLPALHAKKGIPTASRQGICCSTRRACRSGDATFSRSWPGTAAESDCRTTARRHDAVVNNLTPKLPVSLGRLDTRSVNRSGGPMRIVRRGTRRALVRPCARAVGGARIHRRRPAPVPADSGSGDEDGRKGRGRSVFVQADARCAQPRWRARAHRGRQQAAVPSHQASRSTSRR